MKEIFIVTSGCYSDYSIEAVFSTEKKAEKYFDTCGSDSRIERYSIDIPVKKDKKDWYVSFNKYGEAVNVTYFNPIFKNKNIQDDKFNIGDSCGEVLMRFSVANVDSKKIAVKIASERRAYVLSNKFLYPLLFCKCVKDPIFGLSYPTYSFKTCEIIEDDYDKIEGRWIRFAQIIRNPNSTKEEFNEAAIELGLKQRPAPTRKVKVIDVKELTRQQRFDLIKNNYKQQTITEKTKQ